MKNIKMTLGFITLSIALLSSCNMQGQSQNDKPKGHKPPSTEEIFTKLDQDEDDLISMEEVKGPLKDDFVKIDLDEDGYISKEELEKAPKPKHNKSKSNK